MRKLNALPEHELFKVLARKIPWMIKYYRIKIFIQRDAAHFVYIEYKSVQVTYFGVIETEFLCRLPARLVPPAIAEEHAADIEKQDLY